MHQPYLVLRSFYRHDKAFSGTGTQGQVASPPKVCGHVSNHAEGRCPSVWLSYERQGQPQPEEIKRVSQGGDT